MNILSSIAACVRVRRICAERKLRGEHHPVAQLLLGNELAEHLFALPPGISVSRIDEISASLDIAIQQRPRNTLFRAPSPFRTERHGPQAKRAYPQTRASERRVFIHSHGQNLRL